MLERSSRTQTPRHRNPPRCSVGLPLADRRRHRKARTAVNRHSQTGASNKASLRGLRQGHGRQMDGTVGAEATLPNGLEPASTAADAHPEVKPEAELASGNNPPGDSAEPGANGAAAASAPAETSTALLAAASDAGGNDVKAEVRSIDASAVSAVSTTFRCCDQILVGAASCCCRTMRSDTSTPFQLLRQRVPCVR